MPSRPFAILAIAALAVALARCDVHPQRAALPGRSGISPVVLIQAARTNAKGEVSSTRLGSGFIVSDTGHLVTAYHVIENFEGMLTAAATGERIRLVALPASIDAGEDDASTHFESRPLERIGEDPANDLALLKAAQWPKAAATDRPGDAAEGVARLALTLPEPDTPIELAGYPFGARALRKRLGRLVSVSSPRDVNPASDSPSWFEALGSGDFLLAEVETHGGNSGSPVFRTDSGDVIGLCSAILLLNRDAPAVAGRPAGAAAAPFTLVIPSHSIAALLDEHGVDWHAAD